MEYVNFGQYRKEGLEKKDLNPLNNLFILHLLHFNFMDNVLAIYFCIDIYRN